MGGPYNNDIKHQVREVLTTTTDLRMPKSSIVLNHDDPLLVRVFINNIEVHKLLIDIGSSIDIMFCVFFKKMKIPQIELLPFNEYMIGFLGHHITHVGYVKLHVIFRTTTITQTIAVRFIMVKIKSSLLDY